MGEELETQINSLRSENKLKDQQHKDALSVCQVQHKEKLDAEHDKIVAEQSKYTKIMKQYTSASNALKVEQINNNELKNTTSQLELLLREERLKHAAVMQEMTRERSQLLLN